MEDGEYRKSIEIRMMDNQSWSTTLEFKVHLSDPEGCNLGHYLHTCRVKVIDTDCFPSNKYQEHISKGGKGIGKISGPGLFWEYCKLSFNQIPGVATRTVLTVCFDQLGNLYKLLTIYLGIYLVNVLFDMSDPAAANALILSTRSKTATLVGAAYVAPMLVLHAWDLVKAKMDLRGHLRLYLQCSLFRKYLNYSEASRSAVLPADIQNTIMLSSEGAASGYCRLLGLVALAGQLGVFVYFTLVENPGAVYLILTMPCLMFLFVIVRAAMPRQDSSGHARKSILALASEVCQSYRLIADYFQRPQMNELFASKAEDLRRQEVPENIDQVNVSYVAEWLGPVFIGLYIAIYAQAVFDQELSLGTFLATINVIKDISAEFSEAYQQLLELVETFDALRSLTKFFNRPTDLLAWKKVNRERREATKKARDDMRTTEAVRRVASPSRRSTIVGGGAADVRYKTDLIPITITDMSYSYQPCEPVLHNVSVSVPQGKLVAVVGPHGSGKTTLLKLLGHMIFPQEGTIFVPAHLRILHVSQEASILNLSAWQNLTFGCPNINSVDPDRIQKILKELKMKATLNLIENDLRTHPKAKLAACADASESCSHSEDEMEKVWQQEEDPGAWQESLTYTEKVKLHLARALIMNPEVLVLQRPLHHYDAPTSKIVLQVLNTCIENRGLFLPEKSKCHRRPRTCFFTVEDNSQAHVADYVWHINRGTVADTSDASVNSDHFRKNSTVDFGLPDVGAPGVVDAGLDEPR
eukprot:TRINITY_DN44996_c0_g1_i1.p1 TRINITY_DN44996_c0_g1~~TRINITY_DN44996_c0_g1_i1.p1  ORF type:complete len:848 (+),score=128.43 TRINITY_DN44996_c0_g1_i1:286-2544(+)